MVLPEHRRAVVERPELAAGGIAITDLSPSPVAHGLVRVCDGLPQLPLAVRHVLALNRLNERAGIETLGERARVVMRLLLSLAGGESAPVDHHRSRSTGRSRGKQ